MGFRDLFAGALAGGAVKISTELLKVSDAMADVQKTTGMALEEVKNLWDAFDKFDTRTQKMNLLKIAEVGGRLGVPKEEMASFVQEVDKAYVALGDSFEGGLEAVVDSLGKIKGLFEETKGKSYAEAINEVGSALNELAASGTASEGNISDFALRVGALPDALKPSIDKVLGLGAAFEESGVDAQIAASGYSNFMKVAGENLQSFAYSMNISYEEAQKLFNEKPEEFFLRFAQGMKGVPAEQTAKIFDSLKIGTLEVQKAVGAAANRTDDFRVAMNRASTSMEEASSLNDEFNKKNNNAAAIWEKLTNAVSEFFTKTNILNMFEGLISSIGWLTGVTNEASDGVRVFRERMVLLWEVIKVAIITLVSYQAGVRLSILLSQNYTKAKILEGIVEKAGILRHTLARQATLLYAYAKALLTGNIEKANKAMRIFNITTKANPLGLIASLVIGLGTAFYYLSKKVTEANDSTVKALNSMAVKTQVTADIQKKIAKEEAQAMSDLKKKTELYIAVIKNKNASLEARKTAYEKLIAVYPEFEGTLDKEYRATNRLTKAYDDLNKKLTESSRIRAYQSLLDQFELERVNAEQEKIDAEFKKEQEKINNKAKRARNAQREKEVKEITNTTAGRYFMDSKDRAAVSMSHAGVQHEFEDNTAAREYKNAENKLKNAEAKSKELIKRIASNKDLATKILNSNNGEKTETGTNRFVPDAPKKSNRPADDKNKAEEDRKKDLENAQKARLQSEKEALKAQQDLADEKLKILDENQANELAKAQQARDKELTAQKQHGEEILRNIAELEEKKKQAQSPQAQALYQKAIDAERQAYTHNQQLIEQSEQTHQKKLLAIKVEWSNKAFQKFVEDQTLSIEQQRATLDEEIQAIDTMEKAKLALSKMTHLKLTEQELDQIKTLEDAKKALRENADRLMLDEQLALLNAQKEQMQELLGSLTGEELEKWKKAISEVEIRIIQIKSTIQGNAENDNAKATSERKSELKSIDVLGFSADDWAETFDKLDTTKQKVEAVAMAMQALGNAANAFAKLQNNLNQNELSRFTKNQDKKKKALLKQLNEGYISQEQYHRGIEALDAETANKKSEIAYRLAKVQKAVDIMNAISGAATAIVGALGAKPWTPANLAFASIVGALGAVQIATVASTPLPTRESFAQGGYTGAGIGSVDHTGFRPADIVHENEYVTPEWMLKNPIVANVVSWLESIRTGRIQSPKGYAEGGLATASGDWQLANGQQSNANSQEPEANAELLSVMSEVKDLLSDLNTNGVEAWLVEDAENGKRMKRTIKMFERIQEKNARK